MLLQTGGAGMASLHSCVNQDLLLLVRVECLCWAVPALHTEHSRAEWRETGRRSYRYLEGGGKTGSLPQLWISGSPQKKECSWC